MFINFIKMLSFLFFIFFIFYDFQKVQRSGGPSELFFCKNIFCKKITFFKNVIFCLSSKNRYISLMTLSRNKRNSVWGWDRTTDLMINSHALTAD